MTGRERLIVDTPPGGWPLPWPQVAEIARLLGPEHWTLVGGLMVQLHAFAADIHSVRPTTDIDMVVHVETGRGRVAEVVKALESLGYELHPSIDDRSRLAHRFVRDRDVVDLSGTDQVDVVIADHAPPSVVEKLKGYDMVAIDGGTQALRRTVDAALTIDGVDVVVSVPNPYGAVLLKSAAHQADSRDRDRHLADAVVLLACIDDPFGIAKRETSGSDGRRLRHLVDMLKSDHPAWFAVSGDLRTRATAALRILNRF